MKGSKLRIVVALFVAAAVAVIVMGSEFKPGNLWPWSKTGEEVASGPGTEILVMRTPGGELEVARIIATEQFDKKFVYSVLGAEVGKTVAHIRVPATYRYHIELAPEWEVTRRGEVFKVITPPVKPTLPVAVDLAKMEKDVGGDWYLVVLNDQQDLDALEREITAKLEEKAKSDVYVGWQRDGARKTVTEFVEKWLVTQQAWKAAEKPRIEVEFGE